MKNTAVLIDMENLIGGYAFKYLGGLSLSRIFSKLEGEGYNQIAVKRAYADWSNARFNTLKWEIVELGIEPVQMYGFSRGAHKNASDIQLVIDAMELLHTKPFIENYVLVSGDGGFSALVKKISEYGKKVIGVAYENTLNPIFKSVCDQFFFIENTLTDEDKNRIDAKLRQVQELDEKKKMALVQHPLLNEIIRRLNRISEYNIDTIKIYSIKALNLLKGIDKGRRTFQKGMNISTFRLILDYLFESFDYKKLGFSRYSEFIRHILCNSPYKLILKEPSDYRITPVEVNIPGFITVPCENSGPEIHSEEGYINLLKSIHFPPSRILPIEKAVELIEKGIGIEENREEGIEEEIFKSVRRWSSLLKKSGVLVEGEPLPPMEEIKKRLEEHIRHLILQQIGEYDPSVLERVIKLYFNPPK